ncbi:uncharacterized protein BXZ73DRAFT_48822 [Epithele typhae]|uniref:uncharacterized protein n=1 Tax=Epithele typhae TaxID=378194 RepID=UPI002008918D|nr:uncharacterized protein BXZ73DRAFT_48822 [Epithele typhae]KAH9927502.1 hypothetical protein BXZ73DRAFT_48822 [Epithele typhae]
MKLFSVLALALAAAARPGLYVPRQDFKLQNGKDALAQNAKFATLSADSACTVGENACVNNQFAQCVSAKFVLQSCGDGLICAALPLVNSAGTSITCTTTADRDARITDTGATTGDASSSSSAASSATTSASSASSTSTSNSNSNSTDDAQSSFTLLQSVIATSFANDGTATAEPGQVASLTSTNNFINFCATVPSKPLTNGKQIAAGSCNPAPMGVVAGTANMPSAKFVFPPNGGALPAHQNFTLRLAVRHLNTGFFTNPDASYFAGPQTVDAAGDVTGHAHVVIEALDALDQTAPTDPRQFKFFKGMNERAVGGELTAVVAGGLPPGAYRMASINSAANHQPVLVAIAQRGTLDDMV